MAQFESRPEDPAEWAGLPSEPLDRTHATDLESDIAAVDALTLGLGSDLSSIVIPAVPSLETGAEAAPTEPDDGARGDA